jgi:hypothetical protein
MRLWRLVEGLGVRMGTLIGVCEGVVRREWCGWWICVWLKESGFEYGFSVPNLFF